MGEAWGDAPPLITCPSACTDSEKSYSLRRPQSSPIRKDHESRSKQRGLMRSPSVSPFPLAKLPPTVNAEMLPFTLPQLAPALSRRNSRSSFHETAYFTSFPPSAPLALVARTLDRTVDTIHASTSTTCIQKVASYYAGIRCLVEEIAETAAYGKSSTKLDVVTSGTYSSNIASTITSPKSRSSRATRKRLRRHSVAVTRNVAVQAISMNRERKGLQGNNEPEFEWVGGVRALRDSHVRHVLRQLKHIDRLNRALDRVNRSETE